jgi:tyrosine-protein kinase Etk/Wzc
MREKQNNSIFVNTDVNAEIVFTVLKRSLLWVVLFFSIGFIASFVYLRYSKPVYEASMLIQVFNEDQASVVIGIENINSRSSISKEIQLLRSEYLFNNAITRLNLNISYYSKGEFLTEELYRQSSFNVTPYDLYDSSLCNIPIFISFSGSHYNFDYKINDIPYSIPVEPGVRVQTDHFDVVLKVSNEELLKSQMERNQLYFEFNNLNYLASKHLSGLDVVAVDVEAKTIEISHRSNNANLSKDVIAAVAASFFDYDEQLKKESAANVLSFIELQLDSLSRELKDSKDSIMLFQRRENIFDPENISSNINDKLSSYERELSLLEDDLMVLKKIHQKIAGTTNRLEIYKLIPDLIGGNFEGNLLKQIEDLHDLLESREDLLFSVTENNQVIKRLETRIDARVKAIQKSIASLEDRTIEKMTVIQKRVNEYENEYYLLPEKRMELSRLQNLQDLNQKYYSLLTEKKVVYSISNAGYTSQNKILNSPYASYAPISPKKGMVYGGVFFMSFVLSSALLFFRYVTYNEITKLSDLENLLPERVGLMGQVPLSPRVMVYSQLVVAEAPKSAIAEAMRAIRTNLSFVNKDARLIAVSSSISGEGKTFVSLNLAGIIALSGKKTVIIDLDLRKPKVHLGLGLENDKGVSNLLVGHFSPSDVIKDTPIENLKVITAGPIPPNPSELILSSSFNYLIEYLKRNFDTIIIDNPPVGLVSDGVQILAIADVPLYVFKANYSKRNFANRVKELVEIQGVRNLNVILNGVKTGRKGYGYGYGGYYEEALESKKWWKKSK